MIVRAGHDWATKLHQTWFSHSLFWKLSNGFSSINSPWGFMYQATHITPSWNTSFSQRVGRANFIFYENKQHYIAEHNAKFTGLYLWASQVALVIKKPPAAQETLWEADLILGSGRSPGGGPGNPLQYSCLENPKDRGAWRATVHRVAKSWTQLKWLSMHLWANIISFLRRVAFVACYFQGLSSMHTIEASFTCFVHYCSPRT